MTYLKAILVTVALSGTGCAQLQQIEQYINSEGGSTAPTEDPRIPGGWLSFPDADDSTMCNGLNPGFSLPCRDVLNVCVDDGDGTRSTKFMPEIYRCTDASPTWRDVCTTRPPVEWTFYGYTTEECEGAVK